MKIKFKTILVVVSSIFAVSDINAEQVQSADIAPYVFPENVSNSPNAYSYMPDGKSYLSLNNTRDCIIQYDTEKGVAIDTILNIKTTRENTIKQVLGFEVSPNGSKLLVYNNITPIYRRSYNASYYVFDIKRNILKPLSNNFKTQRAPLFSPDSRMIAFVADNNIHIKKLDYDSEVSVTTDGRQNCVINGVPDWTYEEEFMVESSMAWSPDNLVLSYIKYNESDVKTYHIQLYGGVCDRKEEYACYPGAYSYKYPKAGTKNSIATLHSYDVETRKIKDIILDKNVEYIPRISFVSNTSLIVATLNRIQNRLELLNVNPKTTIVKSLYVDESKSWIDEICYNNIKFYPEFFIISSSKSGYNHLYKYAYTGVELEQLTSGEYDVINYYGIDEEGSHYYQSTKTGAINRVISKIDKKKKQIDITPAQGFSSANFSPTLNYYMLNYSNVTTPPTYTLYNSKNEKIRIAENNSRISDRYAKLPKREFFEMESNELKLNGYIIKPLNFDSSRKYPVVMTLYNGPSSQSVLNKWSIDWENYFATQGYIVACVDGRGTAGRGLDFKSVVYKNLGTYETIDQLAAADYISSLPYVDSSRIGICGWSYGGYQTLMSISHPNSKYKAAVAIAPVTDWKFYDTAYTERFMLTPQENEDGYNSSSVLNKVNNVNCQLLIMSGTADDNVHITNTMEYVSELIKEGKYCDMMLFPNMNHSIYHCGSRAVVYAKMLDFFNRNLK